MSDSLNILPAMINILHPRFSPLYPHQQRLKYIDLHFLDFLSLRHQLICLIFLFLHGVGPKYSQAASLAKRFIKPCSMLRFSSDSGFLTFCGRLPFLLKFIYRIFKNFPWDFIFDTFWSALFTFQMFSLGVLWQCKSKGISLAFKSTVWLNLF